MGNWNSCQRPSKFITSDGTQKLVSIYLFCCSGISIYYPVLCHFHVQLGKPQVIFVYGNASFQFTKPKNVVPKYCFEFTEPWASMSVACYHENSIYWNVNFRSTVSNFNLPNHKLSIYRIVKFQFTESWTFNLPNREIFMFYQFMRFQFTEPYSVSIYPDHKHL